MNKSLHRMLVLLIVGIVALGVFKPTKFAYGQPGVSNAIEGLAESMARAQAEKQSEKHGCFNDSDCNESCF